MKYSRTLGIVAVAALMTATVAQAERTISPREAKQAINAMEEANSSLSKAVQVAEEKTGGKAFSVEIMPQDNVEDIYTQSTRNRDYASNQRQTDQNKSQRDKQLNKQTNKQHDQQLADKSKSDRHAKTSKDEMTDESSEENQQLARDDRNIDRQAPHAKVKCLLSGNRAVRCAMVNLENNQVVRVRNIGHGGDAYSSYSQYDRNDDSYHRSYNRYDRNPYDNARYGEARANDTRANDSRYDDRYDNRYSSRNDYNRGNYDRNDDYDNRMSDMRDRDNRNRTQVDYGYIEQDAWPPNRGDRYYDSQTSARAYTTGYNDRNRSSGYNDRDYDRGNSIAQSRGGTGLVLASDLMNAQVRNHRNQDIGDIADLAIDPNSKCLVYATLTHGGFLGLGQKRFAIPSEELALSNNGCVYIDASQDELNERDGFDANNWPKQADSYWRTASDQYMQDQHRQTQNMQKQNKTASEIAKASEIFDQEIVDESGQEVGEVEDLIVDPSRGKVAYLLVEVGEGTDEGLVAIPASAVKHQNDKCVVQASKSTIESAQKFSSKNQPNWNNMRWNEQAHARFNVEPYWRDTDRVSSSQAGG